MSDLVDEVGVGEGRLAGGDSRDYELELEVGELVRLEVEQRGVDVAVELRDPQDNLLIRVDSPTGRRDVEKLLAVAETTGTHRLVIEGAEPGAPEGEYVLRILETRPANLEDRDRAAAECVFSQAEELRRQGKENGEALQRAVERYQEALAAWRTLGDPGREGDSLLGLGRVHEALGNLETARQLMGEAVERFIQAGRPRGQGTALNFLGYLLRGLGETDEALQRAQEALEVFRAADIRDGVAAALEGNLGPLYRRLGETEKALDAYRQALEVYEEVGEIDLIAQTRGSLATLYLQQGEVEVAEDHLEAALSVWKTLGNQRQQALVLHRLGEVRKRQERLDEAVDYLEQALELNRSLQDRRREATTLNALGTVQLLRGAFEPARVAYEGALALYQELENARGEAYAIHNLGRLYLPAPGWAGDPQQALGYFERAAPFLEKLGDRQVMASNTYGSARALAELGRPDAARERLAASFGLVEELRTETSSEELRIAFFATKQHYYDLYVDVLMRLDEQEPGKDWAEKAFEVSEHRRARTLLDTLGESASEIRRGADPALLEEEAAIQAELNVLERRRRALVGQAPANRIALAPIEKSVRQNREKLDDVRRRLRNAAYDRLAGAKPLTLSEIRGRLLNSRTLLLVYSLGEERSFLWAVSRDAVRSRVLAQGRAEIEVAVEEARDLLTSLSQDRQNARQRLLATLGDQLLGPVADELTYKRLVIVADGALLYLPFAALPKPGAEPGPDGKIPFLVEHHEIVNLPSASLLEGLRREFAGRYPAPKQIAVFADPMLVPGQETPEQHPDHADLERSAAILGVERFEPLPGTRDEARVILDLAGGEKLAALGADATKEKIVGGELKDYQILHFATHGIVNREAPELSGLVLSLYNASGLPVDGFLHLHEIYNLDLSAELVVLSACETGLGPEVRGEGLIGLTRGFMYAGVPRILVNLWRVCDRGTAELMRGFYWSLFEVGAAPAEALRAAQISLLENDEWNHPIYWASFVLQGDWRLPGGGGEDFDIEGAFLGGGVDDEEDMDLQFPGYVCADPSEPWMRTVYEILRRLRQTGDSSMNGNQASSTGIDLETGQPIQDALSDGELRPDPRFRRNQGKERERAGWHETFIAPKVDRRPAAAAVDSLSLASSGWGVVFPKDLSSEIRENLQPLLDHRRRQATRWNEEFYKELVFESGDTKQRFTSRYEVMHGPVDPARGLPYYLMIVGGPKEIPYSFQYLLDVPFAVGRLYFDNPEDYGRYARSVIEAERGHHQLRPEMTFFSVAGDKITTVMADRFVDPLYMSLQKNRPEWTFRRISNGSKDDLRQILGGPRTPSLLLTAAHGLPCKKDSPQQRVYQGAILCQDWHEAGAPGLEHCFSAADLDDQAHVHGLVVFLFGCYSAGTPQTDNYPIVPRRVFTTRAYDKDLASEPFLSALAQRLLAHPNGGALAVIGHVDRAWSHSFGGRSSRDFTHIEALLRDLLDGYPVGSAMDWMHERFAEQSTMLTEILNEYGERRQADRAEVARLWRANNDARNFVVLGDPAVHLAAGPRAALSGMSLLYDRAPESRRPLKRVNWRQFLGRWEPEQVRGLSPVDAVRRIRSLK